MPWKSFGFGGVELKLCRESGFAKPEKKEERKIYTLGLLMS